MAHGLVLGVCGAHRAGPGGAVSGQRTLVDLARRLQCLSSAGSLVPASFLAWRPVVAVKVVRRNSSA